MRPVGHLSWLVTVLSASLYALTSLVGWQDSNYHYHPEVLFWNRQTKWTNRKATKLITYRICHQTVGWNCCITPEWPRWIAHLHRSCSAGKRPLNGVNDHDGGSNDWQIMHFWHKATQLLSLVLYIQEALTAYAHTMQQQHMVHCWLVAYYIISKSIAAKNKKP